MKPILLATCLASTVLIAACGGGGSSGSSPEALPATTPTPSTPVSGGYDAKKAWVYLFSTTRSWSVSGVGSDGKTYNLTLAVAPGGTAVFPVTGVSSNTSVFHNVLMDGATVLQDVLNEQFLSTDYRMLGSRLSTDGGAPTCSKTEVVAALPSSGAAVGTTGPLYAATTLDNCSSAGATLGTSYHTWSVLSENSVVYLCVTSSNRFIGEVSDRISETCVETDASGNLGAKARIKLVLPGFSVVAVN